MQASTELACNAKHYLTSLCALLLCLAGCQKASETPATASSTAPSVDRAPPSFLDPAPAAPRSTTIILSGGTLLEAEVSQAQDLFDAVVVITNGKLVATGKRGSVPVPADSVGIDTSGKYIVAEPTTDSSVTAKANLTIYHQRPGAGVDAAVFARVTDGVWVVVD
ncbi:MAG: hypothetical protein ACR2PZ_17870 [Pseudomonadales bacterium]